MPILESIKDVVKTRLAVQQRRMAFYRISGRANAVSTGTWQPSDRFLARIKAAYRLSVDADDTSGDSMWKRINARKRDIHEALMGDDPELGRILAHPAASSLYLGVDSLTLDQSRTISNGLVLNCLVRLAEAVGARRVWNVEAPRQAARLEPRPNGIDVEQVLAEIERAASVTLDFPNPFPDESGLPSSRGIITFRALQAVYQAWRLRQVASLAGVGTDLIEIGAGVGRTAFYADRFGMGRYTIVDLPLSLVGQACFLGATLGEDAVSMLGEADGRVRLLPLTPSATTPPATTSPSTPTPSRR